MTYKEIPEELARPENLLREVTTLRDYVVSEADKAAETNAYHVTEERQNFKESIYNLLCYMALRRQDVRDLQDALRPWGLSSLGRIEAQVLPNLNAVIATLAHLVPEPPQPLPRHPQIEDFEHGAYLLQQEANGLFGPRPEGRRVRTMVTLPTEAADDPQLVYEMVKRGMNIARVNCAHDDAATWQRMIDNVHQASAALNLPCKISMDLGGPKIRTSAITLPSDKYRIQIGDRVLLTNADAVDTVAYPIQVRCTLPEVIDLVEVGQPVWFDDGKIGTRIIEQVAEGWVLEVANSRQKGERLREEKGINFPQAELHLHALTEKDREDLAFVVQHADIINYSFVQTPDDVRELQEAIAQYQPTQPLGLVLKVETAAAIRHLPELIITAGAQQPVGVMIARGDLAVEIGSERLAEMQEEIMWICEAAHTPVIWATQVLETLAKKGRPSRAEVTDAAMAERAECVMLNKGPYILEAIRILDTILTRMGAHQSKKSARLRALRSW
ncbi:hypothetical protein G4Y79_09005 [Phototrophicus methaneseepsis]|uniref:Pyruvate kinase n=1 Tax=Phototrophicus methaneseepsis TaxID=2710758 RepID=A0A7S8IG97_9CHLR|nr:pyruvate kinase [Phototrophicus methaneseepsis]QPC84496.1 hypothetical protein G4Y79_09005 [Phototrophicus methaneseepsis]